jgi:hypothetical protein
VQLEVGSTATSFDYRPPYGTELALCQRYYESTSNTSTLTLNDAVFVGQVYANLAQTFGSGVFRVSKRAAPTIVVYDGTGAVGTVTQNGIANGIAGTASNIGVNGFNLVNRTSGTFTGSYGYPVIAGFTASAEL